MTSAFRHEPLRHTDESGGPTATFGRSRYSLGALDTS